MKIAIDLGTTYSVVYVAGQGVVLREASAIAFHRESGRVLAYGDKARGMLGRAPISVEVIRPLREGVIAHFDGTREILRHFIEAGTQRHWIKRSQIVICVPHGATPVEMDSLRRESLAAGARHVDLVKEPFAAALGAGLPIDQPRGSLIVDVGGGTTEATAISLNNVVYCESLRMAGNAMDLAIEEHFRSVHHFAIGEATAERIKIEHASVLPPQRDVSFEVRGLNLRTGRPDTLQARAGELHEALEPIVSRIVEAIRRTIEHLPPELSGDVLGDGAVLVGGGALLPGWTIRVREALRLPIRIDEDPLMAVTRGLIRILDDPRRFSDLIRNSEYPEALAS